jgi:hypothetical protein
MDVNSKNFYCFMIIGSNGSVIYYRNLSNKCKLKSSDLDAIGPVLHVINAQTSLVTPPALQKGQRDEAFAEVIDHRLESIKCDTYELYLYTTLSNIKFILIGQVELGTIVKEMFRRIYADYAECIAKMALRDDSQPFQNATFDKRMNDIFRD